MWRGAMLVQEPYLVPQKAKGVDQEAILLSWDFGLHKKMSQMSTRACQEGSIADIRLGQLSRACEEAYRQMIIDALVEAILVAKPALYTAR